MDTSTFIKLLIEDDIYRLNELYIEEDWNRCINFSEVYEKVKDTDNPSVHNILGYMHNLGSGVEVNYDKALFYYKLSIDKGNSYALCNLGYMYYIGMGVEVDYEKSIYYYKLSAEQGNCHAETNLGYMYLNGIGVDKDEKKAFRHYQLSFRKGGACERNNLKGMVSRLGGVGIDYLLDDSKQFSEEIEQLRIEVETLRKENKRLEEENIELRYRPEGDGYMEALADFNERIYKN